MGWLVVWGACVQVWVELMAVWSVNYLLHSDNFNTGPDHWGKWTGESNQFDWLVLWTESFDSLKWSNSKQPFFQMVEPHQRKLSHTKES